MAEDEDFDELEEFQLMQNYPKRVLGDKDKTLEEVFAGSDRENLIVHEL